MSSVNVIVHLTCMDKFMYSHAGMPCKFNHYMHACFACNYPEALSHCGHGHDLTSVAQLSVINIADIRSASMKPWHQSTFAETPSTARRSREARQRRASMLFIYKYRRVPAWGTRGAKFWYLEMSS